MERDASKTKARREGSSKGTLRSRAAVPSLDGTTTDFIQFTRVGLASKVVFVLP